MAHGSESIAVQENLCNAAEEGDVVAVRALLARGASANAVNAEGLSALLIAAQQGHADVLEALLNAGADVKAVSPAGSTALMFAAGAGHGAAVERLLARGAEVNARGRQGETALTYATARGHTGVARQLIQQGADTDSVLLEAALRGHRTMLRCLLDCGVAVNRQDAQGSTPLIHAARADEPAAVEMLLDAGADVNHRNLQGATALSYGWSHPGILRLLATRGADLDTCFASGQTALMVLAERNLTEAAALLLEQGADPNVRDRDGNTALYYAELHQSVRLAAMLRDRGGVDPIAPETRGANGDLYRAAREGDCTGARTALDRAAQIDARDLTHHFRLTALAYAAYEGHLDVVHLLLGRGARVNATTRQGETPLKWAAWNGHTAVVRLLLDHGANQWQAAFNSAVFGGHVETARFLLDRGARADAVDPDNGYTPLLTAAEQNHPEVVRLLLDHGADVRVRCHGGRAPLVAAAARGNVQVARLLLERGAGRVAADLNSAVFALTRSGSADLLALLLAHGADIRGRNGVDVALDAAFYCNSPVLALLLERGVTLTAAEREEALQLVDSNTDRATLAWMRTNLTAEEQQEMLEMTDISAHDVSKLDVPGTKALLLQVRSQTTSKASPEPRSPYR